VINQRIPHQSRAGVEWRLDLDFDQGAIAAAPMSAHQVLPRLKPT
jgi:hypothetical protein